MNQISFWRYEIKLPAFLITGLVTLRTFFSFRPLNEQAELLRLTKGEEGAVVSAAAGLTDLTAEALRLFKGEEALVSARAVCLIEEKQ